ncbi:MAG: DUF1080 domain-containing protein [Kiritimatiellae bacterium]|nr:DUF1080 domain-containing protein [Kiritimatiellia bacterium]
MRLNTLLSAAAALTLAGCATCASYDADDPVVGNWGLRLHYGSMDAGHMILSRDADGRPQALVLWRWASPELQKNVVFDGNRFSFDHNWGFKVEGEVDGMTMKGRAVNAGKVVTAFEGWRNPPVCGGISTKDAVLGDPVDLLADGLDGWKLMDEKAKNGWSVRESDGVKVLSNSLGLKPDGSWAGGGANLMTRRADFYDFNLEYDVRVPKGSNSGVYLRGRYEIQVVDSYGKKVDCHNMAAYYGRVAPSVAAEKKPGEWQHVSVTLYKRHLTVVLNGTTIIDDAPVTGVTGGAIDANEFVPGPIYLQGDHSDADYRNMILRPVIR